MIYHILVKGRVQGVNFRKMTKSYALKNGLKGTVRNLDDGRVEIFTECSKEERDSLVEWLKSSPGFSNVDEVVVGSVKKKKSFGSFEVIREDGFLVDQSKSMKQLGKKILKL